MLRHRMVITNSNLDVFTVGVILALATIVVVAAIGTLVTADEKPTVEHRVTMVAAEPPPDGVIRMTYFDGFPENPGDIVRTFKQTGAINFPMKLEKSACDDAMECAGAIKDACKAIGRKVKKQAWDMARGCGGTCADGTKVEVTCSTL
jgi:hypothetical protein